MPRVSLPMVAYAIAWIIIVGVWLWWETKPTRLRNRRLRRLRTHQPKQHHLRHWD